MENEFPRASDDELKGHGTNCQELINVLNFADHLCLITVGQVF